jgi:hypothetical protein
MSLRTSFPGQSFVFCELGTIHECQFEAQAAVILIEIRTESRDHVDLTLGKMILLV